MPLATNLTLQISAQYTGALDIEKLTSQIATQYIVAHVNGTGAGQATILWSDTRTLASGASETLDLNGPSLVDAFGLPLAITKLKGVIIVASSGNTTSLTIGGVANGIAGMFGAATQTLTLQPGEMLAKLTPSAAGYTVTAATADLLQVANAAGAAATYDIIIIGA